MDLLKQFYNRFSWTMSPLSILVLLIYIGIYPLVTEIGAEWFQENSTVENMQLAVLAVCFIIAVHAKIDKPLFITAALLIVFMFMREINLGRAYFCAQFLSEDVACKWDNMRYGYVADVVRGLYALAIVAYVWKKKVYLTIWRYTKEAPLYVWDLGFLVISAVIGTLAEKPFENEILEEIAELLFYLSLASCLWRYSKSR